LKLLMVFNPNAASGRVRKLLPRIKAGLERFATVDVVLTIRAGDATGRVAAVDLTGYDGLVAVGGDGTLFEVLNGMYCHERPRRVPLGVVPIGTGNAFARDLGLLPGDWEGAIALIAKAQPRAVDVGRVDCASETGDANVFHFLGVIGAGLPVDAMRSAERIKHLGRHAYSLAALWRAMVLKSYGLCIEIDGERIEQDALFIEISNTRYTGTHFLMAPDACFDDGLLDVTIVRRLPRARLLRLFPTIYSGRHVEYEEVLTRRGHTVCIAGPGGLELAPDGEFRGRTPASITCLHRDLEIFA